MTCPVCLSTSIRFIESYLNEKSNDKYDIVQCQNCNLIYSDPFLSVNSAHYEKRECYKNRWEFAYVLNYLKLKTGSKVLEVGCGEGFFGKYALEEGLNYFGLDFNKYAIEIAEKKLHSKQVFVSDLNVFFQKNTFQLDVCFMFHVFEHIDRPVKFLHEVIDNVKSGGFIVMSVPSHKRVSLFYNDREKWDYPPHHLTRWNDDSFKYLAQKNNLKIVRIAYEPLKYKTFLEFNFVHANILNKIKNRYKRTILKLLYTPILMLEYFCIKRYVSDQAMLIVMKKQ
jgi:2-polyprenyl-3-methyl-5-hydroxy-6-metoxy-1,4-benzoquinol methylase